MPKKVIIVPENDAGQRLDRFLLKTYPNLPGPALYKCVRKKDVRVNGGRCLPDQRLCAGDQAKNRQVKNHQAKNPRGGSGHA